MLQCDFLLMRCFRRLGHGYVRILGTFQTTLCIFGALLSLIHLVVRWDHLLGSSSVIACLNRQALDSTTHPAGLGSDELSTGVRGRDMIHFQRGDLGQVA